MAAGLDSLFEEAITTKSLPAIAAGIYDTSGKPIYSKAFGVNDISNSSSKPYTTSTPTIIFSCTKLVTCIAALQLIEQGKLSLSDPVEKWRPEIKSVEVFDGTDSTTGKLKYRAPTTKPTVLHLMTHTVGLSYEFFHPSSLAYRIEREEQPAAGLVLATMESWTTPLVHEPGAAYTYGTGIDWLGFVIEAVTGMKLQDYLAEHILKPLGMDDSGVTWPDESERLVLQIRGPDGTFIPSPAIAPNPQPEYFGGGASLVSTLDDYCKLLVTILNKGTHPTSGVQILKPETVDEYLFKDQLTPICSKAPVGEITSTIPMLTNSGSLLPDIARTWSLGLMINEQDVSGGRKAGSGAWAGLGNLYYWIDPKAGKTGMVMSSVFPFMDAKVLGLFEALERVAYGGEAKDEGRMWRVV
jgi:methyl acetate hydrolase